MHFMLDNSFSLKSLTQQAEQHQSGGAAINQFHTAVQERSITVITRKKSMHKASGVIYYFSPCAHLCLQHTLHQCPRLHMEL